MDLTFKFKELSNAVFNMQASGCKLVVDFSSLHEDTVSVNVLSGVDLLKYLAPMKLTRFMNGAPFELAQGLVPFGNIEDFLPVRKSRVDPQICRYELFLGQSLSILIAQLPIYILCWSLSQIIWTP